jgi:hypothetical protein
MGYRLLLDENVEREVGHRPEHYGHDVVHVDFVSELGKGSDDGSLTSYTRPEDRILLTYDDDFVLSLDESDFRTAFYEALEDVEGLNRRISRRQSRGYSNGGSRRGESTPQSVSIATARFRSGRLPKSPTSASGCPLMSSMNGTSG